MDSQGGPDASRWRLIEEICQIALDLRPEARAAYLASACGDDAALRREVDQLLTNELDARGWLSAGDAVAGDPQGAPEPDLSGHRFGGYQLVERLGAGGMGIVYRARDLQLGRDVAVKTLPASVAADPKRLARLDREARLMAQVNHPHIAAVHGLVESEGRRAIVLELVEGATLAETLNRGPMPIDRALTVGVELLEALDHAHRRGIVHRDLKPANIILTRSGVKLLDFGVGKWINSAAATQLTEASSLTGAGAIVGTLHYMAPEQLEGKPADARSDLFSFGAVLYEMLSGRRAFVGSTQASVIAGILEGARPRLDGIGGALAPRLDRALAKCLERDPDERWQSAKDLGDELRWMTADLRSGIVPSVAKARLRGWPLAFAGAIAGVSTAVLGLPWLLDRPARVDEQSQHLRGELGATVEIGAMPNFHSPVALSPDGSRLAFIGQQAGRVQLFVRALSDSSANALAGTEGAQSPFFSPDGEWLAFFADARLKKIRVSGGPVVVLADAPDPRGGAWSETGVIAFMPGAASGSQLMSVAASGGAVTELTHLVDGELTHRWPQFIHGGRAVLYTSGRTTGGYNDADIVVQQLPAGERKVVYRGGYHGYLSESGHLLFVHDRTLMAAPIDLATLETVGPPVPMFTSLRTAAATGGADFALSRSGTLVYLTSASARTRPLLLDRNGVATPLPFDSSAWRQPRISPDGRRIAVTIGDGGGPDIYIADIATSTLTRFSSDRKSARAVWTPDGRRLIFASKRDSATANNLYWQNVEGGSEAQRLTRSPRDQAPAWVHPTGRFLTIEESRQSTAILLLSLEGSDGPGWTPPEPTVLIDGPGHEAAGQFSRDGRWFLYASNDTQLSTLFVASFPGGGGSRVIADGAANGRWSAAHPELIYSTEDRIMIAPIADPVLLRLGVARPWPNGRVIRSFQNTGWYDLHPNGDQLLMNGVVSETGGLLADFVFHFDDELRRLALPAAR